MGEANRGRKIPIELIKEGLDLINKKDNIIRVGDKSHGAYMLASNMELDKKGTVTLVSRGKYHSKTIDIVECIKRQRKEKGKFVSVSYTTDTTEYNNKKISILQAKVSTANSYIQKTPAQKDEFVVFVGDKPHSNYMYAATFALYKDGKVVFLSKGRHNSKAIDLLENLKRQYIHTEKKELNIHSFDTWSEEFPNDKRVSVLQIEARRVR